MLCSLYFSDICEKSTKLSFNFLASIPHFWGLCCKLLYRKGNFITAQPLKSQTPPRCPPFQAMYNTPWRYAWTNTKSDIFNWIYRDKALTAKFSQHGRVTPSFIFNIHLQLSHPVIRSAGGGCHYFFAKWEEFHCSTHNPLYTCFMRLSLNWGINEKHMSTNLFIYFNPYVIQLWACCYSIAVNTKSQRSEEM